MRLWIKSGLSDEQRADALQQRSGGLSRSRHARAGRTDSQSRAEGDDRTAEGDNGSGQDVCAGDVHVRRARCSGSLELGRRFFSSLFGGTSAPAEPAKAVVVPAVNVQPKVNAPSGGVVTSAVSSNVNTGVNTGATSSVQTTGVQTGVLVPRSSPTLPSGFDDLPGAGTTFYQGPSRSSGATPPTQSPSSVGAVATKSWDGATQVKSAPATAKDAAKAVAPQKAAAAPSQAVAAPPKAKAVAAEKTRIATAAKAAGGVAPTGTVTVQVAAVRSAQEAQTVASRLQSGFVRELGGRAPVIDQTTVGSIGTVYRVQVGPYASAQDTQPLCAKLKSQGMDCRVVPQ